MWLHSQRFRSLEDDIDIVICVHSVDRYQILNTIQPFPCPITFEEFEVLEDCNAVAMGTAFVGKSGGWWGDRRRYVFGEVTDSCPWPSFTVNQAICYATTSLFHTKF